MRTPENLIPSARVAELLGVTTKTLRALYDAGKLPRVRIGAGTARGTFAYDPADVEAFIRGGKDYGPKPRGSEPPCPSTNRRRRRSTTTTSNCEVVDFAALRAELKGRTPAR